MHNSMKVGLMKTMRLKNRLSRAEAEIKERIKLRPRSLKSPRKTRALVLNSSSMTLKMT